jgi:hypothetical protein
MRHRWLSSVVLAFSLACASAGAGELLSVDDVRPGMKGTGRTVFEGSRIDEFDVRILGVLDNAIGPKQSMILARLEGGPLAETGVIAGMSGSPVFIDGKLVGAVAYAFPFGKEAIAGITPIAEMLEATRVQTPRAASARFPQALGPGGLAAPLDREAVAAIFARPRRAIVPGAFRGEALPSRLAGAALTPLAVPLVFSGFDPATFEWARDLFASMGFTPVLGPGASSSDSLGPLPDVKPGAAIGVSLIEGDLELSATGTITHIDQGRVYAFGHPFYNLGPIRFPMKKAYVYSVFPSVQTSWKIAAVGESIGTVEQDRTTAIAGRLGAPPPMIDTQVTLRSPRSGERTFRFRLVKDELFTPMLAYVSVLSVLQGHERAFGTTTLRLDARLTLEGGREIRVQDLFAAAQPAQRAAALLAGPLALLAANDFQHVAVDRIDIAVVAEEENRSATIVRAWADHGTRLKPGATGSVKVVLQTHRGGFVTHSLPLPIPVSAPPGTYDLLVGDAATFNALEQREMRQAFVPRDLGQLLRALNELRSGNRVYARLTRPGQGAIVGGTYLPGLPASVLSVLRAPGQGGSVVPLRTTPVWAGHVSTDHAVSGARRLRIVVER